MDKQKRIEKIKVRAGIYVLALPVLILYALALSGCISVSPGIPTIYIATLELAQDFRADRIRIGYFGICGEVVTDSSSLKCSPTTGASTTILSATLLGGGNISSTLKATVNSTDGGAESDDELVETALGLQRNVLVSLLPAGGVLILLALLTLTLIKIYQRDLARPEKYHTASKRLSSLVPATLYMTWLSTMIAFASALVTTEAVTGLQYITTSDAGRLLVSVGMTMQVLQWLISGISLLYASGVSLILRKNASGPVKASFPPPYSMAGPVSRPGPPPGAPRGPTLWSPPGARPGPARGSPGAGPPGAS